MLAAHQVFTSDFWSSLDDYDIVISDIVIQEASKGDETHAQRRCQMIDVFQGLKIDAEVKEMVNLVSEGKRGDSDD